MSLHILQIICQKQLRSGGGIQMAWLSMELARRGHHVVAVYGSGSPGQRADFALFEGSGVDLRFLPMNERAGLNLVTMQAIRSLRRLLRQEEFDVIHAHRGAATELMLLAAAGTSVPIVSNRGMSTPLNLLKGLKFRHPRIARIITVAEAVRRGMVETGRVPAEKIEVVYGSLPIEAFVPGQTSTLPRELGLEGHRVLGYVGSNSQRKGLPHLLEAFARLRREPRFRDLKLVLVGVMPDQLDRIGIPDGLGGDVIATGFRRDVVNCLAAFDVFAFAGISGEGLTGTVREAAAMALPIVTSAVAGNTELIVDGQTGLAVPPGNAAALADAVASLFDDPDHARRLGAEARQRVAASMSNEARTDRVEAIYQAILGDRTSAPDSSHGHPA